MLPSTRNQVLLIVAWLFVGGAALTLIPVPGRIQSDLGYFSLCPFAPWSTLILLLAAGVCGALRTYLVSRTD